jgi:peptidoglycan/xylan/chitin deacetylase (PgdA/CDA1 family)
MNLRIDRIATLYLMSPLRRILANGDSSVPVLMYHSVSDDSESRIHPYYQTTTAPEVFAAQMEFLYANGYRTCTLGEAINYLNGTVPSPSKPVVITFDDGFADFYRSAFPIMNRYGLTATVYLPTAFIGERSVRFLEKDCLSWSQVNELYKYGISFGSHTVTHPRLRELNAGAIKKEIVDSKRAIEAKLGCAVDSFAYPYAFPQTDTDFKKMLRELLQEAGYQNGVSTILGRASRSSDPLFVERLPVNSFDDLKFFQAKLAGAYDWLAMPQRLTKMAKTKMASPRSQHLTSMFSSNS